MGKSPPLFFPSLPTLTLPYVRLAGHPPSSLWVYESPPLSHSLSYELPDLGDHPPIHDGRVSDHIDHHRVSKPSSHVVHPLTITSCFAYHKQFIPSSPYTYNPYAPTHFWPQHPQPPQPYLDVYPPPTHYSPHMPRGDVAVPPARRCVHILTREVLYLMCDQPGIPPTLVRTQTIEHLRRRRSRP